MRVNLIDPLQFVPRYTWSLLQGLLAQGHNAIYATSPMDRTWDNHRKNVLLFAMTNVFDTNHTGLLGRFRVLRAYLQYAACFARMIMSSPIRRSDVWHSQWTIFPLLEAVLLARRHRTTALVFTAHDTVLYNGRKVSTYSTAGYLDFIRKCDHVIVHTKSALDYLEARGVDAARISVIPHGPLTNAGPTHSSTQHDKVRFVQMGVITSYKGADVLVEAVSLLSPAQQSAASFLIVGRPEEDVAPLVALISARGVGHTVQLDPHFVPDDDIESLLGDADFALFPYRKITASGIFSITEKMGIPAIASSAGIFAERIRPMVNGILVRPGDATELAKALARVIDDKDLRVSLKAAAAIEAEQVPSWDVIATQTTAAYQKALAYRSGALHSSQSPRSA